jgi:hypothetical protein
LAAAPEVEVEPEGRGVALARAGAAEPIAGEVCGRLGKPAAGVPGADLEVA